MKKERRKKQEVKKILIVPMQWRLPGVLGCLFPKNLGGREKPKSTLLTFTCFLTKFALNQV